MKTSLQLTRYVVITLYITFGLLGFTIAPIVIRHYAPIARGLLGLVAIYLAFKEAASSRNENPIVGLFSFPKNYKYFIYTFVYSLVFYWALQQIYEMIMFILNG